MEVKASPDLGTDGESIESHDHQPVALTQKENQNDTPLEKLESSGSNFAYEKSEIVPRSQRRGLLIKLCIIPEYENPRNFPRMTKLLIVLIVACCAIVGPMGTSIMLPAIDDVASSLDTSVSVVNVSVGIYLLTLGIFPLWWSSFSERFGRRSVYVISFGLFVCFSVGTSLSPTIGSLIGFRVLSGGSSASVQSVGAGTIADLYAPSSRGRAMGYYYLGPLMGPMLAPIIGGALAQGWGWRATQWFLVIFSGVCFVGILFLLPETLRKQDNKEAVKAILASRRAPKDEEQPEDLADPLYPSLSRVSTRQRDDPRLEKLNQVSKTRTADTEKGWISFLKNASYIYIFQPMKSVIFLRYTPVLVTLLYSSPAFAVLYFVNMTLAYEYARPPYNFQSVILGLVYIPNSVAYIIASIYGGKWTDHLLNTYKKKYGVLLPETRISYNVLIAAIIFPISLLITGWCLDQNVHWVAPLVGTALFGFASMMVIGATVTYLVDTLPGRGATAVALNNLIRMILAAIATFITEPLIKALGVGVLFSILAGIMCVLPVFLILLKWRGNKWREELDLERLYQLVE